MSASDENVPEKLLPLVYDDLRRLARVYLSKERPLKSLKENYPNLKMLQIEDAQFANAPHLRAVKEAGWNYILNVKPDSHKSLLKQCE